MFKLVVLIGSLASLGVLFTAVDELPGLQFLIVPTVVIIILILLNGLFVVAEFALIGVRPSQVEQLANEGHGPARNLLNILRSSEQQNRYVATAQLGITLASIGLGMYGESQVSHFIESYLAWLLNMDLHDTLVRTTGYLIALGILTYLHIVLGEMVPKSLALTAPRRAALIVARPMRLMERIFSIPVTLLNGFGNVLMRLIGVPPAEGHERVHSPEEIDMIVSESAEEGAIREEEQRIIHNIFDFGERRAHQVMTPRSKMEALACDTTLPDLLQKITDSKYSRLPVYKSSLDNVVGMVHLRDLVRHCLKAKGNFDLRLLLRPVPVIPENYSVEKLLTIFKRQRIHMAIVLNEYGGTAGLVTFEDLIEEVVGEVQDEFDEEREPLIEVGPGTFEIDGQYLLDDLLDYVPLNPETLPEVETVGGLILTKLGRLPRVRDQVVYQDDIHFTVLEVDGRAVTRIQVKFPVHKEEASEDPQ